MFLKEIMRLRCLWQYLGEKKSLLSPPYFGKQVVEIVFFLSI